MFRPIWVYWESPKRSTEPAYITLCRWTMLHNWSNENIIFVNSDNIDLYLPGINDLTDGIHSDVLGRLDRFKRKFIPNNRDLAIKCDVYRANLIKNYGGIYCDASTIALKSLTPYFNIIEEEKCFLVSQRSSFNKNHYPVSFYGSPPNSKLINSYVNKINTLLKNRKEFSYNEIGAKSLTEVINYSSDNIHVLGEKNIMPITFENAEELYLRTDVYASEYVDEDQVLFKLFNKPFSTSLREMSINKLYYSDLLVGRLFRLALPEEYFKLYCRCNDL